MSAGSSAARRPGLSGSGPRRIGLRVLRALLLGSLIIAAGGVVGVGATYWYVGKTPNEIIRYVERRLEGHPRVEGLALPVLYALRSWIGEPEYSESLLPFAVPADLDRRADPGTRSGGPANRILRVGPRRSVSTVAEAARLAKDGDIVEIDPGDYRADVASWDRAELTLRGVGGRVRMIAAGADAEGKAIWVIRRGNVTVENIEFIGARVADGNGAGIRFESGHLLVRNCLFFGNENGLLASAGDSELEIEGSEFAYNGAGDGQTHNLYVGNIKSLTITGSYFHHANVGHLIKSRAATNFIAYNRLTDEMGGRASYELEFPNGGIAYVVGNIIQQTRLTSNSTLISFGAEGYLGPDNEIFLVNNTLVNEHPHGGIFLRVMPGVRQVRTQNNVLVGRGRFHTPAIRESVNDVRLDFSAFANAVRQDYRLTEEARRDARVPAATLTVNGVDLTPRSEYVHPMKIKPLRQDPFVLPGATQTPVP